MSIAARSEGRESAGGAVARHLLGLEGVPAAQIEAWLERAAAWLPVVEGRGGGDDASTGAGGAVAGLGPAPVVANLFLEDSTRTRTSFERAARLVGLEVATLTGNGSSVSKGETLLDTARTIEAMGVSAVVVRTGISGGPQLLARHLSIPVVNAGDGRHEHPTQGLLDLLALRRALGSLEGRRVGIVGDLANSRVARSDVHGLVAVGAVPVLVGPATLVPAELSGLAGAAGAIERSIDFDAVLPSLDAVIMLRVQRERDAGSGIAADYPRWYRLDRRRMELLPEHAVVMHPGPVNRGVEIDPEVADEPRRSLILDQVTGGVALRSAVLEWVLGPADRGVR
jgi:aspartate carbamoyltransferase catalytic subunit